MFTCIGFLTHCQAASNGDDGHKADAQEAAQESKAPEAAQELHQQHAALPVAKSEPKTDGVPAAQVKSELGQAKPQSPKPAPKPGSVADPAASSTIAAEEIAPDVAKAAEE